MKPDASTYNPSPQYCRELLASTPLSIVTIAEKIGIHERTLRRYSYDDDKSNMSYTVQFAIECLVLAVD